MLPFGSAGIGGLEMRALALVLGIAFGLVTVVPDPGAARDASSTSASDSGTGTGDRDTDLAASDQFDMALNAWLDNDDAVAIPMLSRLATEGHVPAQIFLGRIASRIASEFVEGLPRAERNRLLRAPGGLSGKSWLAVAANAGSSLAQSFEASTLPPYRIEELHDLLRHGETAEATSFLLRSAASGRMDGLEELLEHTRLPKAAAYTIWLSIIENETENLEQKREKIDLFLHEGGVGAVIVATELTSRFGGRLPGHIVALGRRLSGDRWAMLEPMTEPIVDLRGEPTPALGSIAAYCNSACQDEVPRCMYDSLVLVGGYDDLWRLMSPVESYLPTPMYHRSKRVVFDIERTMRSRHLKHHRQYRAQLAENSCAATPILRD